MAQLEVDHETGVALDELNRMGLLNNEGIQKLLDDEESEVNIVTTWEEVESIARLFGYSDKCLKEECNKDIPTDMTVMDWVILFVKTSVERVEHCRGCAEFMASAKPGIIDVDVLSKYVM